MIKLILAVTITLGLVVAARGQGVDDMVALELGKCRLQVAQLRAVGSSLKEQLDEALKICGKPCEKKEKSE